jgi:ethanolamine utilization protein EutA
MREEWGHGRRVSEIPVYQPPPDTIILLSAGIDIGSATSQMLISRLTLKRLGRAHSSRYVVANRESIFDSPVIFTPYIDDSTIDADGVIGQIAQWLDQVSEAGEIESGVVLLTGEAVRRNNAEAIANRVSALAGDFVCAAAGDLYEAQMAAMGSGAVEKSRQLGRILNIDIGGGTTKLSVVDDGEVVESAVVRVGSRGIVRAKDSVAMRLEVSGRLACADLGLPLNLGDAVPDATLRAAADWMIDRIDEQIFGLTDDDPAPELRITPPLTNVADIGSVIYSSGVAEYIHRRTSEDFGDLGRWLADAVHGRINAGRWSWNSLEISNPLRATATGISQYTVEVSGDTIYVGAGVELPQRNRQVIEVDLVGVELTRVHDLMREAATGAEIESVGGGIVWKLTHRVGRGFDDMAAFARTLGEALKRLDGDQASVVILGEDIAMTVGRLIGAELAIKSNVVMLDGVSAEAAFLDVGRHRDDSATVPIILKSLVFEKLRGDLIPSGAPT